MSRKILLVENDVVINEIDVEEELKAFEVWKAETKPKVERMERFRNWFRFFLVGVWGFTLYSCIDAFYDHHVFQFYLDLFLVLINTVNLTIHLQGPK